MRQIFYKISLPLFLLLFVFVPVVFAQEPPQFEQIFPVIYNAIRFFFGFISIIAAAMIVYGAYMWMASGGDPQKTKLAQGVLTWAVVGLIFFMIFIFLMDTILRIFGIELPVPDQPVF